MRRRKPEIDSPSFRDRFLEQLERYCVKNDYSYTEAAIAMETTKQVISSVLNRRPPSLELLAKACEHGGFNLNYTMTGAGKPFHALHLNATGTKNKKA